MLSLEVAKVASLRFLWSLGWVHLDEFKGLFENCIEPICQFGWRLLILHGKYSRLHLCFDKVNNGPTHKTISGPILYLHSRCGPGHQKLRGELAPY